MYGPLALAPSAGHLHISRPVVSADGLVSKLGLKNGDLVVRLNGEQVTEANFQGLADALTTPGTQVIAVVRGPSVLELKVLVR